MEAERGTVAAVSCNDTYAFTKPVRGEIFLIAGVGVKGDVHAGVHVKHRGRVRNDPTQPNLRQVHLIQQELFGEVGEKGFDVAAGNLGENVTTSGVDLLGLPRGTILRFGQPGTSGAGTSGAGSEGAGSQASGSEVTRRVGAGSAGAGAAGETAVAAVAAVLEVAAAASLNQETARSAEAVAAAAARDRGDDQRPAVIVAGLRNPCGQINGFRAGLLKEVLGKDEHGGLVRKAGVMAVVLRGGAVRPGDVVTVELPPGPHAPLEPI